MKKLRILVVEDNVDNIKAAKAMLAKHDITVVSGYDYARRILSGGYDSDVLQAKLEEMGFPEHRAAYSDKYGINFWDDESDRRKEWEAAKEKIQGEITPLPFDILLTDVMVPKGGHDMLSDKAIKTLDVNEPMPYGAYIALYAIKRGLKMIGIITSGNHHEDPFVYALDGLNGFTAGDLKVVITNHGDTNVLTSDYKTSAPDDWEKTQKMKASGKAVSVKDWAGLLNKLLGVAEE